MTPASATFAVFLATYIKFNKTCIDGGVDTSGVCVRNVRCGHKWCVCVRTVRCGHKWGVCEDCEVWTQVGCV